MLGVQRLYQIFEHRLREVPFFEGFSGPRTRRARHRTTSHTDTVLSEQLSHRCFQFGFTQKPVVVVVVIRAMLVEIDTIRIARITVHLFRFRLGLDGDFFFRVIDAVIFLVVILLLIFI